MKRTVLFFTVICFCFVFFFNVGAQQRRKQRPLLKEANQATQTATQLTASQQEEQPNRNHSAGTARQEPTNGIEGFDRLKGTWNMTAVYDEMKASIFSDGRASIRFEPATLTEEKTLGQSDPNTITFDFARHHFFTLKSDAASKKYFLTVEIRKELIVDSLALVYSAQEGFTSQTPASTGDKTTLSPKITFDETGAHTWLIKPGLKVTFTKTKQK